MEHLLFLAHRIPYPPNKGDKVRSYHLLRYLAARYAVHLGAFVDDKGDWAFVEELRELCAAVHLVRLNPRLRRLKSLSGLLSGEPLTLPYFRSASMQRWVNEVFEKSPITRVVVFSSAMAQYVTRHLEPDVRSVLDFVDVDSDKWRQYAAGRAWPLCALYRREADTLLSFERKAAAAFEASLFVSDAEAALFRRLAPERAHRVLPVSNGVDHHYFSPDRLYTNPYPADEMPIVFTGAMDYWANIDAVRWFAGRVFPEVRARAPAARFYIVGARPASSVRGLARHTGVRVTGTVDDVRPWLAHARIVVAPLRVARGVQNKVLEAMAMGKPILASAPALEGLEPGHDLQAIRHDRPHDFVGQALRLLRHSEPGAAAGRRRRYVRERYDWGRNLSRLEATLEREAPMAPAGVHGEGDMARAEPRGEAGAPAS